MQQSLNILVIDPYYCGSHFNFIEGLKKHSLHNLRIIGLKSKAWKWQMRSTPLRIYKEIAGLLDECDLIFCTDFLDLATLIGLCPRLSTKPIIQYYHENQWEYPNKVTQPRDLHFGFTHLNSLPCATQNWFNSSWNLESMKKHVRLFLKKMPSETFPLSCGPLFKNCKVMPLGIDYARVLPLKPTSKDPPIILWNHRWCFDKGIEEFIYFLNLLTEHKFDFQLIMCGEVNDQAKKLLTLVQKKFTKQLLHVGFCSSAEKYWRLLQRADLIVSCAKQEFFGISVCEAIRAGCWPLLPNKLSYPEIIPQKFHAQCLYRSTEELIQKTLNWQAPTKDRHQKLLNHVDAFSWPIQIEQYDAAFLEIFNDFNKKKWSFRKSSS